MRARHKALGGEVYAGKGSKVIAEAKERKDGGRVVYEGAGSNVVKEAEEKKHGGRVKSMGKVMGEKAKHRGDKRARGGRIGGGADSKAMSPFASKHPMASASKPG